MPAKDSHDCGIADRVIVNRDAAGFGMYLYQHPPGQILQEHSHPGAVMSLVLSGSFIEQSGAEMFDRQTGTISLRPANETHVIRFSRHVSTNAIGVGISQEAVARLKEFDLTF